MVAEDLLAPGGGGLRFCACIRASLLEGKKCGCVQLFGLFYLLC